MSDPSGSSSSISMIGARYTQRCRDFFVMMQRMTQEHFRRSGGSEGFPNKPDMVDKEVQTDDVYMSSTPPHGAPSDEGSDEAAAYGDLFTLDHRSPRERRQLRKLGLLKTWNPPME